MSDPQKLQQAVHERRRLRRLDALRAVMDSPLGRIFVSEVIAECGIYRLSFASDPHQTAFAEGERNVGLRLLAECQRDAPLSFALMQQETADRAAADRREDEATAKKVRASESEEAVYG